MNKHIAADACPKCGSPHPKSWTELTEDEKIIARVQPASMTFTKAQREKHRFCTRCWFETNERGSELA